MTPVDVSVLDCDPAWFFYPDHHYQSCLSDVAASDRSDLLDVAQRIPDTHFPRSKLSALNALFCHFTCIRAQITLMSIDDLYPHVLLSLIDHPLPSVRCVLSVICAYFRFLYGDVIAAAIRHPLRCVVDPKNIVDYAVLWRLVSVHANELVARLERLSKTDVSTCIRALPASLRPLKH
jgi:hypothetical protein